MRHIYRSSSEIQLVWASDEYFLCGFRKIIFRQIVLVLSLVAVFSVDKLTRIFSAFLFNINYIYTVVHLLLRSRLNVFLNKFIINYFSL
jgi:hypothetical protein